MMPTRLLFVLQETLGWKVYRTRIHAVIEQRQDIETRIITAPPEGWRKPFLKRNNMNWRDRALRHYDPITAFGQSMGEPIRAEIHRFRPDAIYFGGHWLAAAMKGLDPAVPFTMATDHTRAGMERSLSRGVWSAADMAREAALFRSAAHVFPMSDWTAHSLREDCGVDPQRITVMPPSIEVSRFVRPFHEGRSRLRILFIGNDFLRKGGDRLCRWVAGPLSGKAELHVVSGDPDAQADRPGVVVHGRVPNDRLVGELLPAMDALCLPTRSDMSPLVVIEAAAAGLPVVASRVGAIPELVRDGETGSLVDADDDAGFIAALGRLADDPALRRAMGTRAWDFAREKFDAQINYNTLVDSMIDLGRSKAPPQASVSKRAATPEPRSQDRVIS
jgi:glycosyltransferase involved in cell wall biosynthesis